MKLHDTSINFTEYLLESNRLKWRTRFGAHMIDNLEVRHFLDEYSNQILIELETSILEKKEYSSYPVEFKYPENWFQHLKQSIAPKWYLKKYPVINQAHTKILKIKHSALFPDLNIAEKYGRIIVSTKKV